MSGTSTNKKVLKYDVFLNHRGPDTKEQFLVPLVNRIHEASFEPFLDRQGVHHGENVFEAIEEALASARMHIAFFSRNYAQSTYCLSELHQMLLTGRPIITVFYDVLPEHVRRPRNPHGPYAEAFKIHEDREKPDVVESWVIALEKAAEIRGFIRANYSDGDELLAKDIVQEVVRLLSPPTLPVPSRRGLYDWSFHYKLPTKGQGIIFFAADTNTNLHLLLSPEAEIMYPLYEIVIGWKHSWLQTRSEIRRQIPEKTVCAYSPLVEDPLVEDLHHFRICIDAETQLIYVGQGEHPCEEDAFIVFKDPSFLSNIQYFTFSSNDVAITYTGIKVEGKGAALLGKYGQDSSIPLWSCVNTSQILPQSLNVTFSESADNYGNYNWLKTYKLPTEGRGIVCFSVSGAITDVHVAISPKPETVDPMYEFVIGGWGNSECVIRRRSQGDGLSRVRTMGVIKLGKVNQFWVSINVDTQLIHIGTGNEPNLASVICLCRDPLFLSEAQYVSFFSRETTVVYSNIFVASPSTARLLTSQPLVVSPCWGNYDWKLGYKLLSEGRGILYFAAMASTDVRVAISPRGETMDPMYEIVIGGWGNTKSGVRRRSQGELLCSVNEGFHSNAIQTGDLHHFWVSIDKDTELVKIGRGNQANLESVICMYKDPSFLGDAMYIAFSSWNKPVTYSTVSVSFQSTTITTPIPVAVSQRQFRTLQAPVQSAAIHKPIQTVAIQESFHSGNIQLQNPEFRIMISEDALGRYEWRHYFELPAMGQGVVYFAAETITDVHVAISPLPQTVDPMYEVVIGGWNNCQSVIRRKSQGTNLCCAFPGSDGPPITPGLNHYWVAIDAVTRLVKVGWGEQHEIESSILLIYKDANFISNARYVTFTNWNAPVTYSQISLRNIYTRRKWPIFNRFWTAFPILSRVSYSNWDGSH